MSYSPHRRAGLVCMGLALVFSIYSARLVYLAVAKHEDYRREAALKHSDKRVLHASRGTITDVRGEVLADDIPVKTIFVDGSHMNDRERLARLLSRHLDLPLESVLSRLNPSSKYTVIKRRVPEETAAALQAELAAGGVKGVYYENDAIRNYPNGSMLAHVVGFVDHEGTGLQGVEAMMDRYLRGQDGFCFYERDRTGREIVAYRGLEREPKDGMDVELTVDMHLQAIVERELLETYKTYKPRSCTAVFVRPSTGEILAMATQPGFDPNNHNQADPETKKNRAITDMVEPGSTFKIVVTSAVLNEALLKPDSMIYCERGLFAYGGRTLKDHHGYGNLSLHDVLVKSSNIGCAKIAMQLGPDLFYQYIRRFGFGERTGLGMTGEIAGLVHPPHRWSALSITRIPMGHEIAATPMQITMAMAAIANGGRLMMPQIVRRVRDSDGSTVREFTPVELRRVVSEETAREIGSALQEVVSERGTAIRARIAGYTVAGKTGTAQRVSPKGGYESGKYVVSFAGYFPAEDPEVAGIVIVDDASISPGLNYGGLLAAPIFARIGGQIASRLDLPPSSSGDRGTVIAAIPVPLEGRDP